MSQISTEVNPTPDISPTAIEPDISQLAIEDDKPVDNLISEKQQRLLTEPLYSNPGALGDRPFLVAANVGVFYGVRQPPLVPDVFLSLDVTVPQDWSEKKNRTYFVWEFGKPPDVAIEIVSNREGKELGSKLADYARIGVSYYAIFDPLQQLSSTPLQVFERHSSHYRAMAEFWLGDVGLGLTLWEGIFEGKQDRWLRWCDVSGTAILTGAELALQERQRADEERQRADEERQRADEERQRADEERQRAEQAEAKAAQLAERLRALGIDPNG